MNLMNPEELVEADKSHHLHPLTNPATLRSTGPDIVAHAEGVYIYLQNGRRVMDTTSSLWNVNIGYGNQRVCNAAFKAMQKLSFCHSIFGRSNPWVSALGVKLSEITPNQFNLFFFASSGSEAIESCVKMALQYWRRNGKPSKRGVISRRRSYHGNTMFAASLTGIDMFHTQFGLPISDMIHHAKSSDWFNDGNGRSKDQFYRDVLAALEKQIVEIGPDNIAAFIGEPVQTGMIMPPEGYWRQIREICDRYDILLIADEVVSGFGKSGLMFGFENFGFEPDLFAMAKGLTSGYFPMSAVAVGTRVADVIHNTDEVFGHVFTNSGHPVGAAVALENIAVIESEGLLAKVRNDIGPYFNKRLNELLEFPCITDIRSLGVMGAFNVDASGGTRTATQAKNDDLLNKIVATAWRNGMVIRGGGMCLPMIITRQQIDEAMEILNGSIREVWSREQ